MGVEVKILTISATEFVHLDNEIWSNFRPENGNGTSVQDLFRRVYSSQRPGFYTRKNLTTCNKSADKPSTRCVRTACSKVVNKLFQTC